jgi:hypothetical protein
VSGGIAQFSSNRNRTFAPHISGSNGSVSECPPAKVRHYYHTDSAVIGSYPQGDISIDNPNLLPYNLARQ